MRRQQNTEPRMTAQTLAILATILDDPTRGWYGLEIGTAADLKSGTLYPALARLERAGMLASRWEDADPRKVGRPRRRLYELTNAGREQAETALAQHLTRLGAGPAGIRQPQGPRVQPA